LFLLCKRQTKYPLSQDSQKLLKPILQKVLEFYQEYDTIYRPTIQETAILKNPHDPLPQGESYTYIPEEIRNIIEKSNPQRLGVLYKFPLPNQRNAEIYLIGFEKHTTSRIFFESAIKKIYLWLRLADIFAKNNSCSKTMRVYIYFTQHKKQLPRKSAENISLKHANTAFTTSCQLVTEMNMFREEEWFKVFIHETFHNMGFDFSHMDESVWLPSLQTMFQVEKDTRLYESYTEMWAEIVHMLFVVIYSSHYEKSLKNGENETAETIEQLFKQYETNILYEQWFACFQCTKILRHSKINYIEFAQSFDPKKRSLYREETAVFSYFVIRSILLFHLNEFIDWCVHHNRSQPYSLLFTKTPKNVLAYCDLIRRFYKDSEYIEILENVEKIKRVPKWIDETLRMTVFEVASETGQKIDGTIELQ
jgi:hypothetical protein